MSDAIRAAGAQVRRVAERDHEGKPAWVVVAERTYDTDIADLWNAVTTPARIARWFTPVSGDLRLGGRFQLEGNAGGDITRCEPPEALDVTWEFMGGTSWVSVRLAPQGERTHLTLEHIALKTDIPDDHWAKFGPGAVGVGWDLGLVGLGFHVEQPEPMSREDAVAWTWGEGGKAFMRVSAAAWGEAHIEGGENPDVARGMAERTTAAYTGG